MKTHAKRREMKINNILLMTAIAGWFCLRRIPSADIDYGKSLLKG